MERAWGYGSELRNRHENQDCIGVFDFGALTLGVVCDGVGGHVGGAQAATLCVRTVHDFVSENLNLAPRELLRMALEEANQVIYEAARKNHRLQGMGTTAVVAIIRETEAGAELHVAHVGDSRAYLLRPADAPRPLTRDHTMVNLFVDAELLSPEDAATHPEAHVLSRSIGVERAVDVEIDAVVALAEGDVALLCSDGLHGVIEDSELGDVDWGDPQGAINELLEVVIARGGDDNASAIALRLGGSAGIVYEATPPPEPMSLEDILARSGNLEIFAEESRAATERAGRTSPEAPAVAIAPPIHTSPPTEPPAPQPEYVVFEEEAPQEAKEDIRARVRKDKPPRARLSRTRVALGIVACLLPLVPIGVFVALRGRTAPVPAAVETQPVAAAVEPAPAPVAPVPEEVFWTASAPEPPPRPPFHPTRWTSAPPRSPEQVTAVTAAGARQCGASLDAVRAGMAYSPDHAALYDTAWTCFDRYDQRVLAGARARTVDEIGTLMRHLEGDPAERPRAPEQEALPPWGRPAVDGIEYRMEQFSTSTDKTPMSTVVEDRLSAPRVADTFAVDLAIEAQLAAALAKVPTPSPAVVGWWARRVFVVGTALRGPVGQLVAEHRPEVKTDVEALFAQATTPPPRPDGSPGALPPEVAAALEASKTGQVAPAPKPHPGGQPHPTRPKEPSLEDLQ